MLLLYYTGKLGIKSFLEFYIHTLYILCFVECKETKLKHR